MAVFVQTTVRASTVSFSSGTAFEACAQVIACLMREAFQSHGHGGGGETGRETKVKRWKKKKGERKKGARATSYALGQGCEGNFAGGGSQSFPSHFQSFALLSLCFGRLTRLNPALRWNNSPNRLNKSFKSFLIKTVAKTAPNRGLNQGPVFQKK